MLSGQAAVLPSLLMIRTGNFSVPLTRVTPLGRMTPGWKASENRLEWSPTFSGAQPLSVEPRKGMEM